MKNNVELVSPELFAEPGVNTYAILDGASVPGLVQMLHECKPDHECLYRGRTGSGYGRSGTVPGSTGSRALNSRIGCWRGDGEITGGPSSR